MIIQKIAAGLAACILLGAIPTFGTSHADVGASQHGPSPSTSGSGVTFTNCMDAVSDGRSACQAYTPENFTIDGQSVTGGYFVYFNNSGGQSDPAVYDIFQIPFPIVAGTQVIGAGSVGTLGAFLCSTSETNQTQVEDSNGTPMTEVPCTANVISSVGILMQPNANTLQFNNASTSPWTFYTDYTPNGNISGISFGTASVPEPGTLGLLFSGLLGLCGIARRRVRE
jgi:PEP-CTERM motif